MARAPPRPAAVPSTPPAPTPPRLAAPRLSLRPLGGTPPLPFLLLLLLLLLRRGAAAPFLPQPVQRRRWADPAARSGPPPPAAATPPPPTTLRGWGGHRGRPRTSAGSRGPGKSPARLLPAPAALNRGAFSPRWVSGSSGRGGGGPERCAKDELQPEAGATSLGAGWKIGSWENDTGRESSFGNSRLCYRSRETVCAKCWAHLWRWGRNFGPWAKGQPGELKKKHLRSPRMPSPAQMNFLANRSVTRDSLET
ncbi:translation initiation factor IF-2-like [Aquila chrysaetos chrysaetos]|uniref:translation initiation factor IF-2-like n=1 Tax=Aquila chrysaetos chrysaetos TaxID=223781 RepID=UPI001176FBE5|nr:translation initiation factor IF-2-like [Aquila chrysaetos chrysaetos]